MATTHVLQIPGIADDAYSLAGYPDALPLSSWSFGVTSSAAPSGATGGTVSYAPLVVTFADDSPLVATLTDLLDGTVIEQMTLTTLEGVDGGTPAPVLQLVFEDAVVAAESVDADDAADLAATSASFDYETVTVQYTPPPTPTGPPSAVAESPSPLELPLAGAAVLAGAGALAWRSRRRDATPPGDTVPGDTVPGDTVPGDTVPGDTVPGDTVPGDTSARDAAPRS